MTTALLGAFFVLLSAWLAFVGQVGIAIILILMAAVLVGPAVWGRSHR